MGKTLTFLSPLGSLKFSDFLSFLFILKLSYSKPFHNTLNYASTANIEEVMKFHSLHDKTFETDFSYTYFIILYDNHVMCKIYYDDKLIQTTYVSGKKRRTHSVCIVT